MKTAGKLYNIVTMTISENVRHIMKELPLGVDLVAAAKTRTPR